MKMSTNDMAKIGGAAMAIGTVAAVAAGVVSMRGSKTKRSMKKLCDRRSEPDIYNKIYKRIISGERCRF